MKCGYSIWTLHGLFLLFIDMKFSNFKNFFLSGVGIALLLIFLGWILVPAEKIIGVIAAAFIMIVYGTMVVSGFGFSKKDQFALSNAIRFGLVAGAIFAGEMILEYVLLPKDNTVYGYIEFGGVFLMYLLAGAITSHQSKRISSGLWSAVWAAMISSLIWVVVVLGIFYIFRGTHQQTSVFMAEGDYVDFAKSGAREFNSWIMEDFMGAVFYHSLLGPVIALILGTIGSLIGFLLSSRDRRGSKGAAR